MFGEMSRAAAEALQVLLDDRVREVAEELVEVRDERVGPEVLGVAVLWSPVVGQT